MAPKKKKQGTDKIFIGAVKRITVGFAVPGKRQPEWFTFWPNRINMVPADVWGVMLAKKSSPNEQTGEDVPGPVEQYLMKGLLWEMSKAQAQEVHDGKRPLLSPMGPAAGHSTYVPPEPQRGPLTPGQQQIEQGMQAIDPNVNQIDLGEIDQSQVKPPPAPVIA